MGDIRLNEIADRMPEQQPNTSLDEIEKQARELQKRYIQPRIDWYIKHSAGPRFWFRWAGITTIVFSVSLPALAAAHFLYKELVLSFMSIAIAPLTGLSSFYKWERTWRANSVAQVTLGSMLQSGN